MREDLGETRRRCDAIMTEARIGKYATPDAEDGTSGTCGLPHELRDQRP